MLKIRDLFKKCKLIRDLKESVISASTAFIFDISPVLLAKLRYRSAWGKWPDLKEPHTFDEKLLWLMLYWRNPLVAECGDKYAMRSYVERHGLGHILPKLYGVYEDSSEIDFNALPDRFVLKCTHGCKCNVFCSEKKMDFNAARQELDAWMKQDFSRSLGEVHYAKMKPRIICEEFLNEPGIELPIDYKILCFNGKAHCTMVCVQRNANGKPKLDFFDRDWKVILPYSCLSFEGDSMFPKPTAYEIMIEVAERLSKPFPFVRIDLYSIEGRVVLGEMTFTPGACVSASYMTRISQKHLGLLITLPVPMYDAFSK
jgi:hypothetical protein